jgi:hypothetical protein
MKVGAAISLPGRYADDGMQMHVDIGIDSGRQRIWLNNNWQDWQASIEKVAESRSILPGGDSMVVFYGMAQSARAPMIGPARGYN